MVGRWRTVLQTIESVLIFITRNVLWPESSARERLSHTMTDTMHMQQRPSHRHAYLSPDGKDPESCLHLEPYCRVHLLNDSHVSVVMAGTGGQPTFRGYAAASRFMNNFEDVTIFRRFGELHVRNLLHMQCQLNELEAKIHQQDLVPGDDAYHGTFRYDQDIVRKNLMKRLRQLLKEYGEHLSDCPCVHCSLMYSLLR